MSAKNTKKKSIEGDRYYTPEWLVDLCMENVIPKVTRNLEVTSILEPNAGIGRFTKAIKNIFPDAHLTAVDLLPPSVNPWPEADDTAFGDYLDLEIDGNEEFDLILGNPPFGLALEIIKHALSQSASVVFLLRQGFLSSSERAKFFRDNPPSSVFIVANRPAFDVPQEVLDDPEYGWKEGQTDSADYCFVCWNKYEKQSETKLYWLPEVSVEVRRKKLTT